MKWSLPKSVQIDGEPYKIRNDCDYRVVLDVCSALVDEELDLENRLRCAVIIFYEDYQKIQNIESAISEMMLIISLGEESDTKEQKKPKLMDWEQDFNYIAPAVSRVLGYSVRDEKNYTHWYDFVGAYMEIGNDCTFSTIVSIRSKIAKGQKLEDHERKFYFENKEIVDFKKTLTEEEKEFLSSDW